MQGAQSNKMSSHDIDKKKYKRRANTIGNRNTKKLILALISTLVTLYFIIPKLFLGVSYNDGEILEEGFRPKHWLGRGLKYDRIETVTTSNYEKERANACLLAFLKEEEIPDFLKTMQFVEDSYNNKYGYDWVILTRSEFTEEQKQNFRNVASGKLKIDSVPQDQWASPPNIDVEKFEKNREVLREKHLGEADDEELKKYNRFWTLFFYKHPLVKPYEFYMRISTKSTTLCNIDYDVFRFMKDNNKKYGFISASHWYSEMTEGVWNTAKDFMNKFPEAAPKNNSKPYSLDDEQNYNRCQFLTQWEIASFDIFRSDTYANFVQEIDSRQGIFNEFWQDATIRSLYVTLFLDRNDLHHFRNMGYNYSPFILCPTDSEIRTNLKCACTAPQDFTWHKLSCIPKWYDFMGLTKKSAPEVTRY